MVRGVRFRLLVATTVAALTLAGCSSSDGSVERSSGATSPGAVPETLAFDAGADVAPAADEPLDDSDTSLLAIDQPDDPAHHWRADLRALNLPATVRVATVTGEGVISRDEPGEDGPPGHWFPNPTQFDGPRVFLVVDETSVEDYVQVALPVMPNGQVGWIPRAAVTIDDVTHRAVVDLTEDSVTVWDHERIIVETKAVTGRPSTPTPLGTFYVRDIIEQEDPAGSYGPHILALSGFSEVLDSFAGALPAIAIHGTNNPGAIGSELSSGCVRIPNDLITILAETVPLGTPVTVVA